ncbi:ACP S-malonyltransferase [Guyparkeria sp. 1SP6A2]|nr:ACP S-malonyltransferase [Guyparkeria sp. 1SP6A2]
MIAGVFPGQGSQSIGMASGWGEHEDVAQAVFDRASDVLGYDLWALVAAGEPTALNQTERTQPAMLAADVAAWHIWRQHGGAAPVAFAGHSLGEYAALVAAESIDFEAAVALVAQRGRLMQSAVAEGQGAMAAVLGLDDEAVRGVCEQAAEGQVCEAVNFNAPGQVVIAGDRAAVERAEAIAGEQGAKRFVLLPVSVPSHSSLMRDAAEELRGEIAKVELRRPVVPVIHNADALSHENPEAIATALVEQLYRPVQWVACVKAMQAMGAGDQVEFGPGKVLTGLARRIDRGMGAKAVFDQATLEKALGTA